jgi:hypothetical protein
MTVSVTLADGGTDLRTHYMKSTDLFSHPYVPEVAPISERDSEPVQAPTFSDNSAESESTAAAPRSH